MGCEKMKTKSESLEEDSTTPISLILAQKEIALEERTRKLNMKERELRRRERLLDEREKAAEDKMKTAERMIKEYREMKSAHLLKPVDSEKLSRKQVHFAYDAKENLGKYTSARDKPPGLKFQQAPVSDYRKKLSEVNINDDIHRVRRARPIYKLDSKPLHVMGMR